ncbi:unnamed protein product [Arabidopsis halleri]
MSSSNAGTEVFINFRGEELRNNFISHLHDALHRMGIKAFIDSDEPPGEDLDIFFKRIEQSKVALAVLSSRYTESHWCLEELAKIKECVDRSSLRVIPIFYNVDPTTVKELDGDFGVKLWDLWRKDGRDNRILKWDAALQDVVVKIGMVLGIRNESEFVNDIVKHVQNALEPKAALTEHQTVSNPKPKEASNGNGAPSSIKSGGQRLTQLEEKLDLDCNENKTRYVGIVGMAGIGKTYLANKLFQKLKTKIGCNVFLKLAREKTADEDLDLEKRLVEGLLNKTINFISENPLEERKNDLIQKKVVVVLDNVSDQKEIEPLLENCNWIKEGSIIVITTRDKSLLKGMNCDIYEVPKMNDRDSLELFKDRAQVCSSTNFEENFMELSKKFVDYAGGNPLALKNFGKELYAKEKDHWEKRLETLTQCSNPKVREKLRSSYDELNEQQKDVFLDIAHFFRSEDEKYVTSLLDSFDPGYAEAGKELIRGLVDKFLISVCDGRVEMHNLLLTMAKEHVGDTAGKYWLWSSNCEEFTSALSNIEGKDKVRGIIIDMSNVEEMPLDNQAFVGMSSLRYLKVCDTGHSEAQCKLNLPDVLEFPKDNIVRYLNWVKFPGKELPSDFEPTNLIDLRLLYSKITSVWKDAKVAPELRWVDLSHSSNLSSLLGLSEAPKLLRLNLEGCTSLKELPQEMQKMKKLVSLNLRGCTSLLSLPKITMDSLKTLILSGCSKLQTFEVISKHLATLYLNSTAINELPPAIGNLHGLIFLDLKDCKNLATLPDCLWKLKSLQELKLSGCSKLKIFPTVKETMVNLRILLLDGTSIPQMPSKNFDLSFLRRLCLSRNEEICSLLFDMSQLYHLKWLELKYCKNLTSLPKLPPNLLCLNAHGCSSLRTVASPLASLMPTEQIHSTFILTDCHKLEHVSKNAIISYIQKKSQLMSNDRHNQDFVFKSLIGTCFPGCDVPVWFNHQALGSVLRLELPQDGNEGRLSGIFLCVVVSFKEYKAQNNSLQVRCTCEFSSVSRESFIVGGWSEPNEELHKVVSDHVFIGYSTLFNSKQRQQFSSATEVSLRFEVTNGTREVAECKVMKCGFSLVYESDEAESATWEAKPINKRLSRSFSFPWK